MVRTKILQNILNSKCNAKGTLGELLAYQGIKRYTSVKNVARTSLSGDLWVSGIKLEVKTATHSKSGYKVCLYKRDKHGYTDYRKSDYILIQTISDNALIQLFLIPTSELTQKHITIGKNTRKYAKYRVKSYKSIVQRITV